MKLTIEWSYKTPKGATTVFRSEPMSALHALMIAEDIERTGRVKSMEIVDEYDSTWMIKELKKYLKEVYLMRGLQNHMQMDMKEKTQNITK